MYRLFFPLLILEGFCLWHAYKNHAEQKWYWIIVCIPYVGCFIYLYDAFYARRTGESLAEGLKQVVSSNYKIEKLEQDVQFSSNVRNKINLAEGYAEIGRYKDAIAIYEECREGFMIDDEPLSRRLLQALFLDKQYDRCISIGNELKGSKSFRDSDARISLAWALHHQGFSDQSYLHFKDMDREFSNYDQRYAFCRFLMDTGKHDEARKKADVLMAEFDMMKTIERRVTRHVIDATRLLRREMDGKTNPGTASS